MSRGVNILRGVEAKQWAGNLRVRPASHLFSTRLIDNLLPLRNCGLWVRRWHGLCNIFPLYTGVAGAWIHRENYSELKAIFLLSVP